MSKVTHLNDKTRARLKGTTQAQEARVRKGERRERLTAQALWNWARAHAKRHEDSGKGTQYPTMRDATKRFRCSMDDIENVIGDDIKGDSYLGIATALGVPGGGIGEIEPRGAYLIEAY